MAAWEQLCRLRWRRIFEENTFLFDPRMHYLSAAMFSCLLGRKTRVPYHALARLTVGLGGSITVHKS